MLGFLKFWMIMDQNVNNGYVWMLRLENIFILIFHILLIFFLIISMDYFYYLQTIKNLFCFGITAMVSLMIPLLLSLPIYSPSFLYMRAILLKPK